MLLSLGLTAEDGGGVLHVPSPCGGGGAHLLAAHVEVSWPLVDFVAVDPEKKVLSHVHGVEVDVSGAHTHSGDVPRSLCQAGWCRWGWDSGKGVPAPPEIGAYQPTQVGFC